MPDEPVVAPVVTPVVPAAVVTPPAVVPAPAAPATIVSPAVAAPAAADPLAVTPVADWPTDWREKLAGEDKAYLKTLARYASPVDLAKKTRSLEQKLSSGDYVKPYPAEGTPEEQATWNKEQGIPDKPEGYVEAIKLPDGLVTGEADKPLLNDFAKSAQANHWTQKQFNEAASWYYSQQETQKAAQSDADDNFHRESLTALGAEYGPNAKREISIVSNFLHANFSKEMAAQIMIARDSNGRMLGDNVEIVKAFNALARKVTPLESLLPAGTSDVGKAVADEMNEIRVLMRDSNSAYWQGPKAAGLQARFLQLTQALENQKARAA